MTVQTKIVLTDDVDGGAAAESVTFGLDGISYEIDLAAERAAELRAVLAPFVEAARQMSPRGSTVTRVPTDYDPQALRAWASAHQIALPARGRIPADVVARFRGAGH